MSDEKPTSAGRGLLFISFAKLWFMVAGYAIQFGLPRALAEEGMDPIVKYGQKVRI